MDLGLPGSILGYKKDDVVLSHFDPEVPISLACDASSYGLGTVLSHVTQEGHNRPIAFAS